MDDIIFNFHLLKKLLLAPTIDDDMLDYSSTHMSSDMEGLDSSRFWRQMAVVIHNLRKGGMEPQKKEIILHYKASTCHLIRRVSKQQNAFHYMTEDQLEAMIDMFLFCNIHF